MAKVADLVAHVTEVYVKKGGESNLVAVIRQRLAENPNCKVAMIFHEHAPIGGPAPEIFGLEPRDKHLKQGKKQAEEANRYGAFMRKHFPEVKILVGNSLVCGEFIAELIRNGFKEEYADYMGLEVMGNEVLPELQHPLTTQAAELMQLVAKRFGYTKWGVDQCFESNFRQDAVVGAEEQASYYVRDILLSYIWGFPDIYVGGLADCANQYEMSAWGNDGFCTRYPYLYPKRCYVAVATATNPAIAVLTLAATLAGSVMGDHCSPISDTTILSSTGAQCKHINHVMTQIPYAACAGAICLVLYLVLGFLA